MRLLAQQVALAGLLADREQADPGLGDAEPHAGQRDAGERPLGEQVGGRLDAGAGVEEDQRPGLAPGRRRRAPGGRRRAAGPRVNTAAASAAPVEPIETIASAAPSRTRRAATRTVASRLVRTARAGSSSMSTTWLAGDDRAAARRTALGEQGGRDVRRADEHDLEAGLLVERQQGAVDHRLGRAVAAHQVEGDADHGRAPAADQGCAGQTARTVRLS